MLRRSTRQSLASRDKVAASHVSGEVPRKKPRLSSSSTKATDATRSQYFDNTRKQGSKGRSKGNSEGEDGLEESDFGEDSDRANTAVLDEESNYGEGTSDHDSTSGPSGDEGESSDEQPRRKLNPAIQGTPQNQAVAGVRSNELWRAGIKTGLPPGTQVIIKKPKPRSAGDRPYSDNSIHPNTLLFLADLKVNNDREWFKMHDPDYRTSLSDWNSFVDVLTQKLISIDEFIPELPTKDITFRLHRDVRFSPDKTPYKPYFSAAWSRTGRKGPYAHYYVQISPGGNSFVGGGLWHPEAQALAALRQDIDQNPQRLKGVLMDKAIRRELLGGAPKHSEKVVQAFVSTSMNAETALKTKPKGYENTHPDIELLRLKNYTVGKKLDDSEIVDETGLVVRVTSLFSIIHPFITCLNRIVLPDPNDEEEEDDED